MPRRLALIIGTSTYEDTTLTRLKAPSADARALADTLRDPAIGGFDEVQTLLDATEVEARRAIHDFFARRHPQDLLLLYFSGHGVKDDRGRLHLALSDTHYARLRATAIPSSYVVEQMDDCRSKRQILILDCCNSGAFVRGSKGDPTAMTADTFAGNGFGRVVLTASDATQYALEGDQVVERAELSLFTHYLLEGLRSGRAAAGQPFVTLDALYDYAYAQVVSHGRGQTPRKWVFSQEGSLVLARNPTHGDPAQPFPEPTLPLDAPRIRATATSDAVPAAPDVLPQVREAVGSALKDADAWAGRQSRTVQWSLATGLGFVGAGIVIGGILRLFVNSFTSRLIAGVIEGVLLGGAQAYGLKRLGLAVEPGRWFRWTLGAVVIRWQIPLVGFPNAGFIATTLRGLMDGLLVGQAQSIGGRATGSGRILWTGASLAGWTVSYWFFQPVFRALMPSMGTAPALSSIIVGAITGACVGLATAPVLDVFDRPRSPGSRATEGSDA
ncbi:MAG: caspase family protein [Gemmatimonadota bacterium]